MATITALRKLIGRVHRDERGAISLETILIIGAITLPILIFILRYGWPAIRNYFYSGLRDLDNERQRATNNQ